MAPLSAGRREHDAAERARRVVADLAARLGTAAPPVRLRRDLRMPYAGYRRGRLMITVPARDARRAPDEEFAAKLAHELAHCYYHDVIKPSIGTWLLVGIAVVLVPALGEAVAILGELAAWATHPPNWVAGLAPRIGGAAGVLAGLAAAAALLRLRDRRHGIDRRLTEIRADLTAAHLLGTAPVIAALRTHIAAGQPFWRHYPRLVSDQLGSMLLRSHPPTTLRITAVTSYEVSDDPDLSARKIMLRARSPHQTDTTASTD